MDAFSLVLLDELGAGTDPQEGSALARAILAFMVEKRVTNLVATHYPELKAFAHATPGVINASMEFDLRTLKPTYHLMLGLPGRSNALAIAERLGLSAEIIESARSMIDPTELKAEDLLNEIHHQRSIARKARGAADRARFEAEQMRKELALRLERIEDERQAILEKARASQEEELNSLRAEMDELRRELTRAHQPLDALKPMQDRVESLLVEVEKPVERRVITESGGGRPLRLGDKIRIRSLKMEGVVSALGEDDVEVQLGNLRVRARLNDLERPGLAESESAAAPAPARKKKSSSASAAAPAEAKHPAGGLAPSPGMELDLRGQRAEDALEALDRYLESAYLAGLPFVRIIHGKGTGVLRQVVREALAHARAVSSWESGGDSEGGEGVTVAKIHSD